MSPPTNRQLSRPLVGAYSPRATQLPSPGDTRQGEKSHAGACCALEVHAPLVLLPDLLPLRPRTFNVVELVSLWEPGCPSVGGHSLLPPLFLSLSLAVTTTGQFHLDREKNKKNT